MNADQFTYWLQGFSELNAEPPTAEQWASIKDHLSLVFHKVTPQVGGLGQGQCRLSGQLIGVGPNAQMIC